MQITLKAMIVDDEPFAREDLRHMLSAHPEIAVRWEAARLDEARRLIERHCPDVVFLDIELRGGSGLDLVKDIDQDKTKVIFVTGHESLVNQALGTGALGCLPKPVTARCLGEAIDKLNRVLTAENG